MNPNFKTLTLIAKFLLIGNILIFVGAYFALPEYLKMHPRLGGFAEIVGFEILTVVDVLAAIFLLKRWIPTGIVLFGITSSIWCAYSLWLQLETGRSTAWIWTPLIAYWDFMLLLFLAWRQRAKSLTQLPVDFRTS